MPGKKQFQKSGLGRSLINKNSKGNSGKETSRHTAVLNDGSDYGKLNLRSVTQESSLDEFINIAQMAGDEFIKDRDNITIITKTSAQGVLSEDEKRALIKEQEENKEIISIPRRPPWDSEMSPEELTRAENQSFLEWRRKLAEFQEKSKLTLTPFEKNVEFWRQLWRVVERSDVMVQVLDARNPLLFLCNDLQKYAIEVDPNKINLIILNKADLLTETQRKTWADYFKKNGIKAVFFSALQESENISKSSQEPEEEIEDQPEEFSFEDSEEEEEEQENNTNSYEILDENRIEESVEYERIVDDKKSDSSEDSKIKEINQEDERHPPFSGTVEERKEYDSDILSSGRILGREELVEYFKTVYPNDRPKIKDRYVTIGLVGYPNVGKSSTINALIQCKKVSISATPGKTKHFQTLFLDEDLCLCDCPGLVFPNFVSNKAEMVLNGILPIDQMTDHVPPINLMISLIPSYVFEVQYSITLPLETQKDIQLTAEQLLNAYGYMRGFMTQRGLPDNPRSARYILKDFVNGKLVYCVAPPEVPQSEFHKFTDYHRPRPKHVTKRHEFLMNSNSSHIKNFDSSYFTTKAPQVHGKGPLSVVGAARIGNSSTTSKDDVNLSGVNKPWRLHSKRNTKQKLRKAFAHLDVK